MRTGCLWSMAARFHSNCPMLVFGSGVLTVDWPNSRPELDQRAARSASGWWSGRSSSGKRCAMRRTATPARPSPTRTDKGDRQYVYRVWPHNERGLCPLLLPGRLGLQRRGPGRKPGGGAATTVSGRSPSRTGRRPGPPTTRRRPTPRPREPPPSAARPRSEETLTADNVGHRRRGRPDQRFLRATSGLPEGRTSRGATGSTYTLTCQRAGTDRPGAGHLHRRRR